MAALVGDRLQIRASTYMPIWLHYYVMHPFPTCGNYCARRGLCGLKLCIDSLPVSNLELGIATKFVADLGIATKFVADRWSIICNSLENGGGRYATRAFGETPNTAMAFPPLLLLLSLLILAAIVCRCVYLFLWIPFNIRLHFRRQGISGPPLMLPFGNAPEIVRFIKEAQAKPLPAFHHDFVGRVLPHYIHWTSVYGKCFLFWFGTQARLAILEPELFKEVLLNPKGVFERLEFNPLSRHLIGDGLVGLRGKKWLRHKRIIHPAFHVDHIKARTHTLSL
ncbi:hypothetical protein EJ110_NYTH09534 [Nymphaea thermarum]|nr:hypothetical protein EJ110_NYTH09534 [Nymphaea thermarum]